MKLIASLLVAATVQQSITIPIKKSNGSYFTAEFLIGSSAVKANLLIDTGSSEFVVTSELCSNCVSKLYKPGNSKTTFNTGKYFQLDY